MNNSIQNISEDLWSISPKKIQSLNIFWIGFTLYIACYVLKGYRNISLKPFELLQFIGLCLFVTKGASLLHTKIKSDYLRTLFILYILWSATVIFRGIQFNYDSVKNMLVNADFGVFPYFAPLILLFPKNLTFYKKLSEAILVLGIFYLLYSVLFSRELLSRSEETKGIIEYLANYLGIACGFILLTYRYHSKRRIVLALTVMGLSTLFSIYKARRGLSSICIGVLIASYFLYLFNTKRRVLIIYLSAVAIVAGAFYVANKYKVKKSGLFTSILERGDEDTRTPVELYFYADLKAKDWIIGKGINGQYYCPDIYADQEEDYRSYIETGYLQIILKGGIVELFLFLLMTIPAVILGIFFSKNLLAKAAGIWILIMLYGLYPATINTFSLRYLLIWIAVGICFSKKIRSLSDRNIQMIFETPYKSLLDNKKRV